MPEPKPAIVVTHLGGDRLRIETRGHVLFADQPIGDGGDDTAPTPTEMFLSSLAACVSFYAERFLGRNKLSTDGLTVSCDYSWAKNPNRIGAIELSVRAPGLTDAKREAFVRVIEHCSVHNTLQTPPEITTRVETSGCSASSPPVGLDAVGSPLRLG
jgi:putative redox protein